MYEKGKEPRGGVKIGGLLEEADPSYTTFLKEGKPSEAMKKPKEKHRITELIRNGELRKRERVQESILGVSKTKLQQRLNRGLRPYLSRF